jgi:hypothetical protein
MASPDDPCTGSEFTVILSEERTAMHGARTLLVVHPTFHVLFPLR